MRVVAKLGNHFGTSRPVSESSDAFPPDPLEDGECSARIGLADRNRPGMAMAEDRPPGFDFALMTPSQVDFKRLDVRGVLARGESPLTVIRRALERLAPGQGLVVLAPFLPSPLIELLRSEGFQSRVESGGGSLWFVYFWRTDAID